MAFCPFSNKECSSECALNVNEKCAFVLIAKGVTLSDFNSSANHKSLADAVDLVAYQLKQLH